MMVRGHCTSLKSVTFGHVKLNHALKSFTMIRIEQYYEDCVLFYGVCWGTFHILYYLSDPNSRLRTRRNSRSQQWSTMFFGELIVNERWQQKDCKRDVHSPTMSCGIATCLNRAIGTAGLSPAGWRPCRPLHCPYFSLVSR